MNKKFQLYLTKVIWGSWGANPGKKVPNIYKSSKIFGGESKNSVKCIEKFWNSEKFYFIVILEKNSFALYQS